MAPLAPFLATPMPGSYETID